MAPTPNDIFNWYKTDKDQFNSYLKMEQELAAARSGGNLIRKGMTSAVTSGITILGLGIFIDAVMSALEKRMLKKQSRAYFEKMLEAYPRLSEEDPVEIAKYWESLMHFAPTMAADPLAAGAYITQSLRRVSNTELGGPPPDTFATLTDIQRKSLDNKPTTPISKYRQQAVDAVLKQMVING